MPTEKAEAKVEKAEVKETAAKATTKKATTKKEAQLKFEYIMVKTIRKIENTLKQKLKGVKQDGS